MHKELFPTRGATVMQVHQRSMSRYRTSHRTSRGAALVLAILIVAVVTILATEFGRSYTLSITRVANRWHGSQAQYYLLGAENIASSYLKEDLDAGDTDNLQEDWALQLPPVPTDDGSLQVVLEDAQGRLNLNNLVGKIVPKEGQQLTPPQRFTEQQRRFIRLVQSFDDVPMEEYQAIELMEAIIDWLDQDDEATGFGGAETDYYSRLEPPYRPANTMFSSVSELRLVRHMTPELYVHLEPLLIALPQQTDLNVNTASRAVLRSLNNRDNLSPMDIGDLDAIVEDRELQPYESLNDFFANPVVSKVLDNAARNKVNLGVATDYFIMHARASVGEEQRDITSLLKRDQNKVRVVQRRYTTY